MPRLQAATVVRFYWCLPATANCNRAALSSQLYSCNKESAADSGIADLCRLVQTVHKAAGIQTMEQTWPAWSIPTLLTGGQQTSSPATSSFWVSIRSLFRSPSFPVACRCHLLKQGLAFRRGSCSPLHQLSSPLVLPGGVFEYDATISTAS